MDEVMYGPMQLLVIVFENPDFHGQIRRELESVMEKGMIRLIDLLFIWKDENGNIVSLEATQLDEEGVGEGAKAGVLAAAQENYGITDEDIMEITEAIPEKTAAAIFIIEHLWAKSLKKATRDAGGVLVSQGMLTPELLTVVGEELAEAVKAAEEKKPENKAAAAP